MLIYNYAYMLKIEPRYHHAWRQFDCLSFAQSYHEGRGGDLFHPKVNNLGVSKNGKASSEFPIVPYLISKIWDVTGQSTAIYRALNILLIFIGLFYVYSLFLYVSKLKIFSALIAAFVFTSGNLSFYSMSTLSDIQALALTMVAVYYFVVWLHELKWKQLILFAMFICIAGLIKASFILIFILCLLWLLLRYFVSGDLNLNRKDGVRIAVVVVLPMILWLLWILHSKAYNFENTKVFFLVGTLPIWTLSSLQIQEHLSNLLTGLLPEFMSTPFILLFIGLTIYHVIKVKQTPRINTWMVILILLFSIVYILLFFGAFDVHDYYLIVLNGMLILYLYFIYEMAQGFISTNVYRVCVVIFICIIGGTYISSIKTWKKVNYNVVNMENDLAFTKKQQTNLFWNYWHDRRRYEVLENDFEPLEAGIHTNDTVFCLGDNTINRSLYLMNTVGYTEFNCDLQHIPEFLGTHKEVRFLVLIDDDYRDSTVVQQFNEKKIFERRNLSVFKLK